MKKQMTIFWAVAAALSAPAAEFRPAAVTAATETYGARYAAAKMIDGDLATYACFQDDSRTGRPYLVIRTRYMMTMFDNVRVCGWNVRWNSLSRWEQEHFLRTALAQEGHSR